MDILDQAKKREQFERQRAIDNVRKRDIETEQPDEEDGIRYCLDCGGEINLKRLEARPHSVRCVDCKTTRELKIKGYK